MAWWNSGRNWPVARTVCAKRNERLMTYAVNRRLEYFDMPQVRAIVRGAAKDNYKLSSLILGIVNSDAFRKQGAIRCEPEINGTDGGSEIKR